MTKILHISDSHGYRTPLLFNGLPVSEDDYDLVIHSGDFCPNRSWGPAGTVMEQAEIQFQSQWLLDNAEDIMAWLGNKPVYILRGNHDFVDPGRILVGWRSSIHSISSVLLHTEFGTIYGYPHTPWFGGHWWGELSRSAEDAALEEAKAQVEGGCDIFVSHGPMHCLKDTNARYINCGSISLKNMIVSLKTTPKAFLCGHIHESCSSPFTWKNGCIYSNAATSCNIVDI